MQIQFHGGNCCAIKHISDLGINPDCRTYINENFTDDMSADRHGRAVSSDQNFYTESTKINGEEYIKSGVVFDIYIDWLAKYRPYGIVEVALQLGAGCKNIDDQLDKLESEQIDSVDVDVGWQSGSYGNQKAWIPFLKKRGFKEVSQCPNTNSGHIVGVYHLCMNAEWHAKRNGTTTTIKKLAPWQQNKKEK